jgi:crossover junction endodeoxyribonuclease RuvC
MTSNSEVVLAIDPGLSGAYAIVASDGMIAEDIPTTSNEIDGAALARLLRIYRPTIAVVEHVSSMPKQGVASTFAFGRAYGTVLGVLSALNIPTIKVTPAQWKHHYRLNGKDKESARTRAIQLFPEVPNLNLKKHHGRAEALLIAKFYIDRVSSP